MAKKILLIGGGGHCTSVLDSIIQNKQYSDIGIIDKKDNIGNKILGMSIIGCDDDLSKLYQNGYRNAFVTVGSIGDPSLRIRLFDKLRSIGFKIPVIIDSTATIGSYTTISEGVFVGKNAVVNAGTHIGKGVIINTASTVEHDCTIEAFSHIAPGAVLCGGVRIGANTHIGAKSVIKQQVSIGTNTIIGMGSVVLKDISNYILAYGNPCKEVKSI